MDCRNLTNEGWWLLRALDDLGHRYMTHGYWLDQKSTLPCRSRPRPAPDYRPSKAGRGGILDLDARVWHGYTVLGRGTGWRRKTAEIPTRLDRLRRSTERQPSGSPAVARN